MSESMLFVIAGIICLFIFRKPIKTIVNEVNDDLTLEVLEHRSESLERIKELDSLLTEEYGDEIPSLEELNRRMRKRRVSKKENKN